ncbi:MAG TPA: Hsp20/alpha crystallin family protein [Xanthomonadales bacterium]|nr:Hsp20/alpha crystallin family protein [Xanthomonadales bacterium]
MTISRYSTWAPYSTLHDELKHVIDKFTGEGDSDHSNVVTSQWVPRVDIREEPGRFVILADIPGVDPNDIEIHMEKGILTIKGERKDERQETDKYTRVERARGTFHRRFALPDSADAEGISASGRHGVLEIAIPKRPEQAARRIKINA